MGTTAGRRLAYFHLQMAAQRLRVVADERCMALAGITTAQAAVMFVIERQPGASQRSIADALHQRESAVTAMVGRLTSAGFVERRPSPTDGRTWEVRLTRRGSSALGKLAPALADLNDQIERAVGADAMGTFIDALEAVQAVHLQSESRT